MTHAIVLALSLELLWMQVKFKDNCVVVDWSGCGDFSTIFEAIADQAKVVVKYQVLCVFFSLLWLMCVLLCIRIVTFQNVAGIFVCDIHIICKKLVWSVGVCISEKRYIYRSNGDHYNSRTTSRYRWRCREDGWASDLEVSRRSLISCLCSFAVGVWGWPQSDRGRTETGVVPSG